jgi:hypothetical protein
MEERKTAGELAHKALSDNTKYDPRDLALQFADEMDKEAYLCIQNHQKQMQESDQDEFCLVYVLASDTLIKNAIRRKFYMWPWLPSPRPDQGCFLYNKRLEKLTKRLWVLPNPMVMAELATSSLIVDKRYETMQAWSVAFYKGTFWEFIRYQHDIKMLSQQEYFESRRHEFIKLGIDIDNPRSAESLDLSKIGIYQMKDSNQAVLF